MIIKSSFPFCQDEFYEFLTSDSSIVLKSSETSFKAFNVFRSAAGTLDTNHKWEPVSIPAYVGLEYVENQLLTHFIMLVEGTNTPKDFSIEYSIDGTNWTILQSYSNILMKSGWNRFEIEDPFIVEEAYRFVRLNVSSVNGVKLSIQRLKFFTRELSVTNTRAVRQFCQESQTGEMRHYLLNSSCSSGFLSRDIPPTTISIKEIDKNVFFQLNPNESFRINSLIPLNPFFISFNLFPLSGDNRVIFTTREKLGVDGFYFKQEGSVLLFDENGTRNSFNVEVGKIVNIGIYVEDLNVNVFVDGIRVKTFQINEIITGKIINFGQEVFVDNLVDRSFSTNHLHISELFFNTSKLPNYEVLPQVDVSKFFRDISEIQISSDFHVGTLSLMKDGSHETGHWEFDKSTNGKFRITPKPEEQLVCLEFGVGFNNVVSNVLPIFPQGRLFDIYPKTDAAGNIVNNDKIIIDSFTGETRTVSVGVDNAWSYLYDTTKGRSVLRKNSTSDNSGLKFSNMFTNFGLGDFTMRCGFYATNIIPNPHFGIFGNIGLNGTFGIGVGIKDGKFHLWGGDNSSQPIWLFTADLVQNNRWYDIEVSRSSGTTRLFIDGIKKIETNNALNITSSEFVLGGTYATGGFSGYVDMRIDDVSVFNVALHTSDFPLESYRKTQLPHLYYSAKELKVTKTTLMGQDIVSVVQLPIQGRVTEDLGGGYYQKIDVEVISYRDLDASTLIGLVDGSSQSKTVDVTTNDSTVNLFTTMTQTESRKSLINDGNIAIGTMATTWFSNLSETQKYFLRFQNEKLINKIDLAFDLTTSQNVRVLVEASNDEFTWDEITRVDQTMNPGRNGINISPSIKYKTYRITLLETGA